MKPQGGSTANKSGQLGEQLIINQLVAVGYIEASPDEHKLIRTAILADSEFIPLMKPGLFYRQLPAFQSIYNSRFKTDFLVMPKTQEKPILIEMKYQSTAGSVDEKLPFWLLSLEALANIVTPVLTIFGDGYRTSAVKWCHEYQKHERRTIIFSSTKTFSTYVKTL